MYLPTLKVEKIDPLQNVQIIINYLSKEKQANTTRPFYEKTISLYPELEGVSSVENREAREALIRDAVLKRLDENDYEIRQRIAHFSEVFDSFIYKNIEAQCRLLGYEWSREYPVIRCYVGYIPFYPRNTEKKRFFVSYHDEERVFSAAPHEINHMIFHEKWKQMHGGRSEPPSWPDPLWYLEEIVVDPILHDESVAPYMLYDNKAYPEFYVPDQEDGTSIMDRVKECYRDHKNDIDAFIEEAYRIVSAKYAGHE